MALQLVRPSLPENSRIALRLRIVERHRLIEELEAVDLVDGARRGVDIVEHNERLALGFQVGLCDDLEDCAVLRENLFEGFFEMVDFDALFEVADLGCGG